MRWAWLGAALLLFWAPLAQAHKPSDSYLAVTLKDGKLQGQWDVALRDLDFAIGLDADGDGNITWGEVRARHAEIAAYAGARLALSADGAPCPLVIGAQQVDEHTDGAYTVMPLLFTCAGSANNTANRAPQVLRLSYALFADIDPQHRGLLNLTVNGATRTAIFSPQAAQQDFVLAETSRWRQFVDYLREGVWHIWIGFDHILFLLSLLLPAVGLWAGSGVSSGVSSGAVSRHLLRVQRWQPVERFGQAFWDVLRIVTAFTLAHSITLTLAALGLVTLPSRFVEATIAASVVLAALNNVWPVFHGRRWMVAFLFGLVHGFGFASVLVDLGLPQSALALALLGFNVGVELGQLAIVAAFLPIAFWLRRSWLYRRVVLWAGSLLIALIAAAWFIERAFDLKLMPF
jgi:hypothetical protein